MFNQKLKYLMYLLAVFSVGLLSIHALFWSLQLFYGFIEVLNINTI